MLGTPGSQFIYQLWYLSDLGREAQRISNDLNDYQSVSLTADGKRLVTVRTVIVSNIWVAPAAHPGAAKQISAGTETWVRGFSWGPDGRIAYWSNASGDEDLWIVGADGRNPKQLTANMRVNQAPSISPDGRSIAFTSDRAGLPHIWKVSIDGSNPQQLTDGAGEGGSFWSPDGRWIYYTSIPTIGWAGSTGKGTIWRISSEGGTAVQITDRSSIVSVVSPDGKLIACYFQETKDSPVKIAILPTQGGAPLKLLQISSLAESFWTSALAPYPPLQWTPDGKAVVDVENRNGVSNLWSHPLNGNEPKQLTDYQSDRIFSFAWSPDGAQLAVARGTAASDAILISNVQ
jgi:Tol biopolymer transport system component